MLQHFCENQQRCLPCVHCVKQALLILLKIFVIGHGRTLHYGKQLHQVAIDPPHLAADQLCHVGIFLLGHDAAAGAEAVVNGNVRKFGRIPPCKFLCPARQMHHGNGGIAEKFDAVVPVTYAVHGVFGGGDKAQQPGGFMPVDGQRSARQRAGAQRAVVHPLQCVLQPLNVPLEHLKISHEYKAEGQGLGMLQMGKADADLVGVLLRLIQNHRLQIFQPFQNCPNFPPQV